MSKKMYVSLAFTNIKKNKNIFFPFGISAVTMIALFYMIYAIQDQTSKSEGFYGIVSVNQVLSLGVGICGIFAAGVIFYTNSFLMKQRSKELGLYSILGMEKRHIANVLFWELALLGFGCTAAGLGSVSCFPG
ncbi:ABC transporter permease [Lachnospiraceae bacterium]|nr:ABC transporter permease [Lachnospiraceae bacterium]